jgi:hypothetical protein
MRGRSDGRPLGFTGLNEHSGEKCRQLDEIKIHEFFPKTTAFLAWSSGTHFKERCFISGPDSDSGPGRAGRRAIREAGPERNGICWKKLSPSLTKTGSNTLHERGVDMNRNGALAVTSDAGKHYFGEFRLSRSFRISRIENVVMIQKMITRISVG